MLAEIDEAEAGSPEVNVDEPLVAEPTPEMQPLAAMSKWLALRIVYGTASQRDLARV